jgi:membrane protein
MLAGPAGLVARARRTADRVLATVPPVRRAVDDLVAVEVVDRSMVIAAQALLALLPLVVVLAAFLPPAVTDLALERLQEATGVSQAASEVVTEDVATVDVGDVRTQMGVVGIALTLLSASSFARAVQRMYERVFGVAHVGGLRGRRRCLLWLLGWLLALELQAVVGRVVGWTVDSLGAVVVPACVVVQVVVTTAVWGWSMHVLLLGRVRWRALVVPALLTGLAVRIFLAGSTVVMGRYAVSSVQQFGGFGLVLAVASWLVAFAAVLVVCAVTGRVLAEDPGLRRLAARAARRAAAPPPRPPAG